MKHIKKFEDINTDNTIRYKKYILYKLNNNAYVILEPTEYLQTHIQTNKLYTYTLNLNKLKRNKNQYFNFSYERGKNVIYDSNDIKDIKDVTLSLYNADKYNL